MVLWFCWFCLIFYFFFVQLRLSAAVVGLADTVKLTAVVERAVVGVRIVTREEGRCLVAAATVAAPWHVRCCDDRHWRRAVRRQEAGIRASWQVPCLVGGVPPAAACADGIAVVVGIPVDHDTTVRLNCLKDGHRNCWKERKDA